MAKEKEIKKYRMVYKCQLCGAELYGEEVDAPDGRPRFQLHGCLNGNFGIGQLIGFEVMNGKKERKEQHTEG